MEPLGNEFQWSRATVSSIVAINIFLYGLMGPFAAALYQRFGLRRSMVAAMMLLSLGYGLSTIATGTLVSAAISGAAVL